MKNIELVILDVCYGNWKEGHYLIQRDELINRMSKLCYDNHDFLLDTIDNMWNENFLESSNGGYYLTDKSLELLKRIKDAGSVNK